MDCKFSGHCSLLYSHRFSALLDKLESGYLIKVNILALLMGLHLSIEQLVSSPGNAINEFLISHEPINPREDQVNKFYIHG